jgi:hypothetical protein
MEHALHANYAIDKSMERRCNGQFEFLEKLPEIFQHQWQKQEPLPLQK